MDKPKAGVGLLLMGKPEGKPDSEESGMGAKDAAMDAFVTAFEEKDRAAMADAMTTFVKACKNESYDE